MLPLIICSVVVVVIAVERSLALRATKVVPDGLLGQVWLWIRQQEVSPEKLLELRNSSPLGRVFAAGLGNANHGREIMKDSIEEAAGQVVHGLERYLSVLGTIAAIAPLIGLLGTVVGMIKVFTAIMLRGAGNTSVLAGGISEALITTAAGLCVAIPALICHRYFERRVDTLVVSMEGQAVRLVDALHGDRRPPVVDSAE